MFRISSALLVPLSLLFATPVPAADTYPERPIRLVVPFPPGGGVDINARILAEPLGQLLGQQVVVDNRPGASGLIGTELASNAAPDGYTLVMGTTATTINVAVYKELPYDLLTDFAPISLVSDQPNILVAHPSLPAKNFKEFVALARSQPGKLTFASAGPATGTRLAAELLLLRIGADMVHVPYKGTGPALNGLLSNEISIFVSTFASALPHVQSGRLRAYGVTTAARAGPLPDVPTLAEAGVPGYEYATWYGVLAPAGTPASIFNRVVKATHAALRSPALLKAFVAQGLNARPSTPVQFKKHIASEIAKWTRVVREARIAQQ
jgi:tripartite-type tricarboxylate transporter receptor subunit TctC